MSNETTLTVTDLGKNIDFVLVEDEWIGVQNQYDEWVGGVTEQWVQFGWGPWQVFWFHPSQQARPGSFFMLLSYIGCELILIVLIDLVVYGFRMLHRGCEFLQCPIFLLKDELWCWYYCRFGQHWRTFSWTARRNSTCFDRCRFIFVFSTFSFLYIFCLLCL